MRENDEVTSGTSGGSLAEGLGETAEPGGGSSTSGPFGDGGLDDPDGDGTGSQVDDTYDETYGDATYGDADGGFGDGDVTDADTDATLDPTESDVAGGLGDGGLGDAGLDGLDLPSQGASPIEGIGYLIDQVRDALFGSDDDAAGSVLDGDGLGSPLGTEPAELATETDLDLTGDGVVDHGDLLEAEQPFDFDAGGA